MGLSRRKYAEYRGVSESAVRKALASGRITAEPDGTIDPVRADMEWDAQTDPAKQRGRNAQVTANKTAEATARAQAALRPVPQAAIAAVNETLVESGQAPAPESHGSDGGEMSFLKARMANEVIKAQTAKVRLQKLKSEVVDRSRALAHVFDLARRERDSWINWPPRVAANMAAELGVDPHAMEVVLDRYLREHLASMAEIKIELR